MSPAMKTIHVHYYAALREQRGCSQEKVSTAAFTVQDLYAELQQKHGLRLPLAILRVAVNDEFKDWNTELTSGDQIVFIPPVAGG